MEPLEGRTLLSGTLGGPITPQLFPIPDLPDFPDFPIFLAPDIAVSFDGVEIADGDNTPSASDGTNFGSSFFARTRTYTVTNTGSDTLNVTGVGADGGFTVEASPSFSLAPGAQTTFAVRISGSAGTKNSVVILNTNVTGKEVFDFAVTGVMRDLDIIIDPGPIFPVDPAPEVTVTDAATPVLDGTSTVDFGSVVAGSASPTKTFTVRNDGDADLTLGAPTVPAGFTLAEPLAATLAAGASDTFSVAVDTSAVGAKSGSISFVTNDGDENPFDFAVQAAVTTAATPEITVLSGATSLVDGSATVDFGTASVGGAQKVKTFTVRNDGTATLTLGVPMIAAGFELSEGLPATLAPGASDSFTVVLLTTAEGTPTGPISIPNDDVGENPFDFTIKGKVVAAPAADAPVASVLAGPTAVTDGQTTPVDFGSTTVGQTGPTVTFTVKNDGGTPLTLGAPSLPAGFTLLEALAPTLAAGASDTFQVALSTAAEGSFSGTVSLATNDTVRNPFDFAVSGFVGPAVVAPPNNSPVVITMDAAKVPGGVVGGTKKAKGTAVLRVSNPTGLLVTGRLAGSVFASGDAAADAGDAIVGSVNKVLKIKPGTTKAVKVKLVFGAPAADADVSLLAPLTFEGVQAGQAVGSHTVRVEQPRVGLVGQSVGAGGAATFGKKTKLNVPVANTGNVPAKGTVALDLIASTDGTVTSTTSFVMASLPAVKVSIKPGQTKSLKLSFTMPQAFPSPFTAGPYTLIVRVASASLGATGVAPGLVLAGIPFVVT